MNKNKNEKQSYAPPQCEVLAVQCEGVIALSGEYHGLGGEDDWT